ncbi:hypothetical protein DBR32_12680 [Taibaiella sp. KBW10]|uniref:hypothetical protein n=1 Tax=Taibaiella sp. KBW10 TaxID=2153357 RepID=UPI000F5A92B8|nr:hypothetical protein [Taibaiella sp. KBW10]RQO30417.1 hypothetical protein DBR32_12680 [Taibaiella sp. KBW10]
MKMCNTLLTILAICLSTVAFSQELVYPKAAFDQVSAKKALANGKSAIMGSVFFAPINNIYGIKNTNAKTYGKYAVVSIFPLTPYIQEWKKLKVKNSLRQKKLVKMSDEVYATRLDVKADEGGNFQFTEMKPGKYFLLSTVEWHYGATEEDPAESYYRNVYGIVEIKTDGEIIKNVKVTN